MVSCNLKKGLGSLTWLVVALFVAACGENGGQDSDQKASTADDAESVELVVYSSRKEHLIKPLFDRFNEETGIKVSYITDGEGPLMARLEAEGERTPADIFITVDAGNLWQAANRGLFQSLTSPLLESSVPEHLRDAENRWFGLSVRARTIVYSTERVKPEELSTYENLASEQWDGRLCLRTSKKVYNQSLVATLIERHLIPENRLRVHEVRDVIDALADEGSVLELRRGWGPGMVTSLIRIEGRPYGLIANNSKHLGGAIDADAADKAARFMQLCDAYGLSIVSLVDTPGFMVGPEAEKTALVRHVSRMFVAGAALRVPIYGVALRKAYGLGAMAMVGGGFKSAALMVSWPTGEFGGMGLEGAVRLGFRKEIAAEPTEAAQQALFDQKVAEMYAQGKAVAYASATELDAVIDPADTRRWIANARRSCPVSERGSRGFVDTW